jgi:uncharacterized LabA/DUF88 family protein
MESAKQRVIVYVDGFNFYYGLRKPKWKRYYWLDVVNLFEQFMRPNQELVAVKYFSARPSDAGKSKRQDAFFQVNNENPKFKLILGKFLKKEVFCPKCRRANTTYEEKETDVRIATQIVADAFKKNCDIAIVVSADSDMVPAIELVRETSSRVFIYFPPNQFSTNLASMGGGQPVQMERYEQRFKKSVLPDAVVLRNGFKLSIPAEWKMFKR